MDDCMGIPIQWSIQYKSSSHLFTQYKGAIFWLCWFPGAVRMWSVWWYRDPWGISVSIRLHPRPHASKNDAVASISNYYTCISTGIIHGARYCLRCLWGFANGHSATVNVCACMNHPHHCCRIYSLRNMYVYRILVHLSRGGAEVQMFAPDVAQMHVIDHSKGQPSEESR